MLLKKHVKNRRKLKILLLLIVVILIAITLAAILSSKPANLHLLKVNGIGGNFVGDADIKSLEPEEQPVRVLKSPKLENGIILPEKYDERKIKARIMEDKVSQLKRQKQRSDFQKNDDTDPDRKTLETVTKSIHIFYTAPVQWYKSKKTQTSDGLNRMPRPAKELINDGDTETGETVITQAIITHKPIRTLNIAFYPALGLYKSTRNIFQQHFENIKNCGVGVLILSYSSNQTEYKQIIELAPIFNLSVTFEVSVASNQTVEFLRQQLQDIQSSFASMLGFYKVFSQSRGLHLPVIYISNAYKMIEANSARLFCRSNSNTVRNIFDAYFIGHIRLKNHAEIIRRLCLDGFYSKMPSNGATFGSTWKNWSYLKSFALNYNLLFVPTVGPGFAERNKFPKHGDIQRHRSNGRYYGVAWRTAILNHVGFINIASFNNWPDGSQIEEAIPKAGYLDYNPGSKTKYLDLTTHWMGNFLKTRLDIEGPMNCYELLNNTIC